MLKDQERMGWHSDTSQGCDAIGLCPGRGSGWGVWVRRLNSLFGVAPQMERHACIVPGPS